MEKENIAEHMENQEAENDGGGVNGGDEENINLAKIDLSRFKITRVLMEDPKRKVMAVEATFEGSSKPAILTMEKIPFTLTSCQDMLSTSTPAVKKFTNDIYAQYTLHPHSTVKCDIIHPATDKHLNKYRSSPPHLIVETPALYRVVTRPHLKEEQFSLQWVYNVLEHKEDVERIIYEDTDPATGFILAPDSKWSGKSVSNLYCLAIVHRKGIKSLRDLTSAHLPLLRNIKEGATMALKNKYGLEPSQFSAYIHYQPSYYHLHVHFTSLRFSPPGSGCVRSHLLDIVISNIELDSLYYQNATLPFVVREKEKLYKKFKDIGYFQLNFSSKKFECGYRDEPHRKYKRGVYRGCRLEVGRFKSRVSSARDIREERRERAHGRGRVREGDRKYIRGRFLTPLQQCRTYQEYKALKAVMQRR